MKISKQSWELFKQEHTKNKLSVKEISMKYNIKYTTIYYGLIRNGVAIDTSCTDRRKFKVNDSYFNTIDTNKKAYILGLLLCDGSNQERESKTNRLYIKLKESDKYLLEQIRDILAPQYKLTLGNSIHNAKIFYNYRLEIASDMLSKSLTNLGMVQDKFLRTLPNVPDNLFGALLRGIFDADGSISKKTTSNTSNSYQVYIAGSNKELITSIQAKLDYGTLYLHSRANLNERDMLYLRFNSIEEKLKLYKLLYSDATLLLTRKFETYTSYVNTVLNSESKFLNQRKAYQVKLGKEFILEYNLGKSVRHP